MFKRKTEKTKNVLMQVGKTEMDIDVMMMMMIKIRIRNKNRTEIG